MLVLFLILMEFFNFISLCLLLFILIYVFYFISFGSNVCFSLPVSVHYVPTLPTAQVQ